ncbi:hypothetical protein [Mycobacteroides abscessus]|uniref:hypothetical protein n=1 Tax=Mycobacteroides abscessus TaxID=36809 RepID=UPI001F2AF166|nr:hypothetical protein [Mycobacteroides abscessus]
MSPTELASVEVNERRQRQEIIDLHVSKARKLRQEVSTADWEAMAAEELESIAAAESSGKPYASIAFRSADGNDESISAEEVKGLCKAYTRITGRVDVDPKFFAQNSEAVLAHAVHVTRCDTPEQAIGGNSWKQYLHRAKNDEQGARLAVAADIESVFVQESAAMFTTRAADSVDGAFGARDIGDHVQYVVGRWNVDTDEAWNRLPVPDSEYPRVILDRLLRPRVDIGSEPFDRFDWDSTHEAHGGLYGPESGAVECLVEMLVSVDRSDHRMPLVINEIIAQAEAARALPRGTLVECVELQWRLAELADLAEQLTMNPQLINEAIVLTVDHPDQLQLFAVDAAA